MLKLMEGLPSDVLGIEATGKVTHEDYKSVLIPTAETMIAKIPIKMLYIAGTPLTGYKIEALWDDGAFGIRHWHQFRRIAVVTDSTWLRAAITMFCPFFPSEIQLFKTSDLAAARAWIISAEKAGR